MEKILPLIFLGILSLEDIKEKKVSQAMLLGFAAVSLITALFLVEEKIDILIGLIPGAAIFALSKITRGKIGEGDGIAILGIGMFLGCTKTVLIFLLCIVATTFVGSILIVIKKKGKNYEMPFIPFLFLGTSLCTFL